MQWNGQWFSYAVKVQLSLYLFPIFIHHLYVLSFFLSIFFLFHLYTFLNNYYSLLQNCDLELWLCKVFLIVLLITFNEHSFSCMVFLIPLNPTDKFPTPRTYAPHICNLINILNISLTSAVSLLLTLSLTLCILVRFIVNFEHISRLQWCETCQNTIFILEKRKKSSKFKKLMMQSRNGKFPLDAFSIVNSLFSSVSFNFCNVSPRSCDVISNVSSAFIIVIFLISSKWHKF